MGRWVWLLASCVSLFGVPLASQAQDDESTGIGRRDREPPSLLERLPELRGSLRGGERHWLASRVDGPIGGPVLPEPSASLLFAAGVLVLRGSLRGPGRESGASCIPKPCTRFESRCPTSLRSGLQSLRSTLSRRR